MNFLTAGIVAFWLVHQSLAGSSTASDSVELDQEVVFLVADSDSHADSDSRPTSGQSNIRAGLISVDLNGARLISENQSKDIATEKLRVIRFAGVGRSRQSRAESDSPRPALVKLVDKSQVLVYDWTLSDRQLQFQFDQEDSDASNKNQIDVRNLDCLINSTDSAVLQRWDSLLSVEVPTTDWLVFERQQTLDFVEGRIDSATSQVVRFNTGDRIAEASKERVTGLVWFQPRQREFGEPIAKLTTVDGGHLFVRSMRLDRSDATARRFQIETVCGSLVTMADTELTELDFTAVRSQYLGDMTPSTIQWTPLFFNERTYDDLAKLNKPRLNESFQRRPLTLNLPTTPGNTKSVILQSFDKGIAIKAGTRIVFPLDGRYSTLQGICGFDPHVSIGGLVQLEIQNDGIPSFTTVLDRQKQNTIPIRIDVKGVQRLTIHVQYYDGRNIGDTIHLCDLRVVR